MALLITFEQDVLTDTDGASQLLNIPAATLTKWRSTGENNIPFIRIGRQIKYRTRDLRAYVDSHTIKSGAERQT
ncbi:MAG: helix-turn-helix domain-containing protein [Methylobacter sp.]|nr:helix-turn-helix domain-containing protein [Methylobacter sp.]